MRIAALYDIHGNLPALTAVLAELADVDVVLVGGDVVWGPWPQETMDALRSLPNAEFIMGNADRDVFDRVDGDWKESNDWCADRLSDEHLSFLRSRSATLSLAGILFCHGSPRSDTDPITVGTPDDRIVKWCQGIEERTIVCGHTHAQFERSVNGFRVVNPGSVGSPFGDPGAYWAVFGPDVQSASLRTTSTRRLIRSVRLISPMVTGCRPISRSVPRLLMPLAGSNLNRGDACHHRFRLTLAAV